jgi:hypothetical protein
LFKLRRSFLFKCYFKKGKQFQNMISNLPKFFNRSPLILDFAPGKAGLVEICPYCNHVLSNGSRTGRT